MTNFKSISELPTIDFELPKKRQNELENLINNLKYQEIDTEEKFKSTLQLLKNRILVNPVSFEQPKIVDHRQTEKDYPSNSPFQRGGRRNIFVVTVEVKFSGDVELFKYVPNGYSFGSNDIPYMYQPSGQSIRLEIDTPLLEQKDQILAEANRRLSITYNFVRRNSEYIETWNTSMGPTIEQKLSSHLDKLKKLYS